MRIDPVRAAVLFELLPSSLRTIALRESPLAGEAGFKVSTQLSVGGKFSVDSQVLFDASADVMRSNQPAPVDLRDGGSGEVFCEDGTLWIGAEDVRARLDGFLLSAPDSSRRYGEMERLTHSVWLPSTEIEPLRKVIAERPLTMAEVVDIANRLARTPEAFCRHLEAAVENRSLSFNDIVAKELDALCLLVGRQTASAATADEVFFGAKERQRERLAAPQNNRFIYAFAVAGSHDLTPAFASGDLLPAELEEVALPRGQLCDPFSLVGALNAGVRGGNAFVETVERLSSAIESNIDTIKQGCTLYAAAFLASYSTLSTLSTTRDASVTWRRLAAHATASLSTRFLQHSGIIADEFWDAAKSDYGPEAAVAAALDAAAAPRWRIDWMSPEYVFAEFVGRINFAKVADHPCSNRLVGLTEKLLADLSERHLELATQFPGPLEGVMPKIEPPAFPGDQIDELLLASDALPAAEACRMLGNFSTVFLPSTAVVERATDRARTMYAEDFLDAEGRFAFSYMSVVHLALVSGSLVLAHRIGELLIDVITRTKVPQAEMIALSLTDLSAVFDSDESQSQRLGSLLEHAASVATRREDGRGLLAVMHSIMRMRPSLRAPLARARAIASALAWSAPG